MEPRQRHGFCVSVQLSQELAATTLALLEPPAERSNGHGQESSDGVGADTPAAAAAEQPQAGEGGLANGTAAAARRRSARLSTATAPS
jgi:hypothetical protein